MDIQRIIGHLFYSDWQARRAFSPAILNVIGRSVQANEKFHGGEIRFAIEGGLDGLRLLRGQSTRERAVEVFSELRVWDTECNNGVLIYVLLADQAVEVIADRGIHAKVGDAGWVAICQQMQAHFSKSEFETGALSGIAAVATVLGHHFPTNGSFGNELPNKPVMLT